MPHTPMPGAASARAPGRSAPCLLHARGLGAVLDDGRTLYDDVELTLSSGACALVGANGSGKSTLLRQLAGDLPSGARLHAPAGRAWLPQLAPSLPPRVVDLLGAGARVDALRRLSAGGGSVEDAALVDDAWTLEADLQAQLEALGLAVDLDDDPARLSGGERQQLRLLAMQRSDAGVLLLDEPSTFLDAATSTHWRDAVMRRHGAVLVVTHDPAWLTAMPTLLELRDGRLQRIDGGLDGWRAARAERARLGDAALAQAHRDRARARREVAHERERLDRRQARGARAGREANQSPLLLDRRADNAERGQGRKRDALAQRLDAGDRAVRDAFARHAPMPAPIFVQTDVALPPGRRVLTFDRAHPTATVPCRPLEWQACGPVRIGLEGRNGSGKTTLLRALRGRGALAHGTAAAHVPVQALDQHLDALPDRQSARSWLASCLDGDDADTQAATRLALLGLGAAHVDRPLASLSGGERMRVAVAIAAWSMPAAPLLLLDEPASHLDLDSVDALVALLRGWPGALLVVSHDRTLLDALALTHRLRLDDASLSLDSV